ncbi:MAG: TM1812 family CRISPR-associated protein [Bacillota bacterium]|nr:TM1812 family CRISPR-associated protein [Bacillota bacterium]
MKLVATIGAGKYEVATYILQENSYETRYCPLAIAGLLRPSVVLLVMTEQAQAKHGEGLAQGLEELGVPFREVLIPNGATWEEMWEPFRILVEQVEPGDEVAFDITHGFRHLPLLSFQCYEVRLRHLRRGPGTEADIPVLLNLADVLRDSGGVDLAITRYREAEVLAKATSASNAVIAALEGRGWVLVQAEGTKKQGFASRRLSVATSCWVHPMSRLARSVYPAAACCLLWPLPA